MVADSPTDTLTFVAGSGMTITQVMQAIVLSHLNTGGGGGGGNSNVALTDFSVTTATPKW